MRTLLKMLWQKCESWTATFCIFSLTFLFFYVHSLYDISWDIWTVRDIQRAIGWLEGRFHWPGPELSGGNNLPGPFFYFLLLPPLLFGSDVYSQSLLWHITWLSLTYTVAFYFLTKIVRHKESLLIFLFVLLAAMGSPIWQSLHYAWNPSFSIMFHLLVLMSLYSWKETNKNSYLYFSGLIIFLGVQVHLLILIHAMTVLLFYFFEEKKKENLWPICIFGFFISSPFLLYNVMSYFHIFEHTASVPSVHLRWLIQNIFSDKWTRRVINVLHFSYTIPLIICFCAYLWNKRMKGNWLMSKSTKNFLIMVTVPVIVVFLFARIHWYTYFIPVFLILLFLKMCDDLMPHSRKTKAGILFAYGIFLLFMQFKNVIGFWFFKEFFSEMTIYTVLLAVILMFSLIGILRIGRIYSNRSFRKQLWKPGLLFLFLFLIGQEKMRQLPWVGKDKVPETFSQDWPSWQKLYPIMERIYAETNWLPKEAMKRILVLGMHSELSLLSYYAVAKELIQRDKPPTGNMKINSHLDQFSEIPSGYIIIQHLQKFISYSQRDWKKYLSHSFVLSKTLKQEILRDKVLLENPKLYSRHWLIPYKVTKESVFQKGFHNIGQPYYWEEPGWLKNCSFTGQFQHQNEFYYCMVLPGYLQRAGVRIQLSDIDLQTSSSYFEITLVGPLIGTSANGVNRDGFAFWSDIQIHWLCDIKRFHYNLPNIGWKYLSHYPDRAKKQAEQFTTPLTLKIPMAPLLSKKISQAACRKENIKQISLTFNHLLHSYSKTHHVKSINAFWERH